MAIRLSQIFVYPIKSTAALPVEHAEVRPRGLQHDRRLMLVDDAGRFITGRRYPQLVKLQCEPMEHGYRLTAPDGAVLEIANEGDQAGDAVVWKDQVAVTRYNDTVRAWLRAHCDVDARLVKLADTALRPCGTNAEVSLADGYPLLLLSAGAVDVLNTRTSQTFTSLHFRPNLVVAGCTPHAEDGWSVIRIGTITFDVVKPCTRCIFTTVDPELGVKNAEREPLQTLQRYRMVDNQVLFGQNLIPRQRGMISAEMPITVLETKAGPSL